MKRQEKNLMERRNEKIGMILSLAGFMITSVLIFENRILFDSFENFTKEVKNIPVIKSKIHASLKPKMPIIRIKVKPKEISRPVLVVPENKMTYSVETDELDDNIILKWEKVETAKEYQLEISTDRKFSKNMLVNKKQIRNFHSFLIKEHINKKIYWHVKALTDSTTSKWSKKRSFRLRLKKRIKWQEKHLEPPNGLSASSNGIIITSSLALDNISKGQIFIFPKGRETKPIELGWKKTSGPQKYLVEIARDNSFTFVPVKKHVRTNRLSFSPNRFMNQTVFWRVKAIGRNGKSKWSKVNRIKIKSVSGI